MHTAVQYERHGEHHSEVTVRVVIWHHTHHHDDCQNLLFKVWAGLWTDTANHRILLGDLIPKSHATEMYVAMHLLREEIDILEYKSDQ